MFIIRQLILDICLWSLYSTLHHFLCIFAGDCDNTPFTVLSEPRVHGNTQWGVCVCKRAHACAREFGYNEVVRSAFSSFMLITIFWILFYWNIYEEKVIGKSNLCVFVIIYTYGISTYIVFVLWLFCDVSTHTRYRQLYMVT